MAVTQTLGIIGLGNMGSAILKGVLHSKIHRPENIVISDSNRKVLSSLKKKFIGLQTANQCTKAAEQDIVIVAVKPEICCAIYKQIKDVLPSKSIVVSVAAGITNKQISEWLNGKQKIVRVMPNLPASVLEGMSALSPNENLSEKDVAAVQGLFDSMGKTVVLPESLMDAFTALSGSGPAYAFLFIEALADGAVREGIPRSIAYLGAAQTILGAAKMVLDLDIHPAELKDKVCSPGGTTIEALATLEKNGFRTAVIQAITDCAAKSRTLGKT